MVLLRDLCESDEFAFFEGLKEWDGEDLQWYSFIWKPGMGFQEMLTRLRNDAAGIDLPSGFVPHSMLYGFVDGNIIGRVSIRHTLNERLKNRGGHIGYAVAKKYRKKGYATEMVRQAILFCKRLGLKSIMVTCADDNVPSWKIIEHFGGRLQDRVWDDEDNEMIRRYWIDII
jgi:predicted acetyltransferase